MNAIYLHRPDGTPTKWAICGNCESIHPTGFETADKCCLCYQCGKPLGKLNGNGKWHDPSRPEGYSLYHNECQRKIREHREETRLESAELIENYTDPVYFEGGHGSYGDSYFADVDELAEWLDDQDQDFKRPEFAHCCEVIPFKGLDIASVIENLTDDMFEDASDHLNGEGELDTAIREFNKANEGLISFYVDHKRKVRIPAARVQS